MKKEIITDKYTGKKSVAYSEFTEEERKQLRKKAEQKLLKNQKCKSIIKESLKKYRELY